MKKLFVVGAILVVIGVLALLAIPLAFVDPIVKTGFEAAGPKVAKVETRLEAVRLSLLSGAGQLRGVFVGNPEGFHSPAAIRVGEVSIALEPRSLWSDKIVIRSIRVMAPEVTVEGGLTRNNLMKIMENVEAAASPSPSAPSSEPGKPDASDSSPKLQIDDFLLTNGKVNLTLGGPGAQAVSLVLPDLHLTGLGQGAEGVTSAELTKRLLQELTSRITPLLRENLGKLGQEAVEDATQKAVDAVTESVGAEGRKQIEGVTKGIGDLLKRK